MSGWLLVNIGRIVDHLIWGEFCVRSVSSILMYFLSCSLFLSTVGVKSVAVL